MIDPRIALMGQGVDIADIMAKSQQYRANQEQLDGKRKLGDLLPRAAGGDQDALNEIAGIDPRLFMQMDERKRAEVKAGIADLGAAVRWADTPEKWTQVQQHYGGKGVDLTPYGFDQRERGMMMLGKLGEYLEGAPKRDLMQIDGVAIDKATGEPQFESPYDRIIPGPNGSFYRVPRLGIGRGGQSQQSAPRPLTDEDIARMDGGQTPPASGNFPR